MSDFPASRAAALARLSDFLPRAGRVYQRDRNHDTGPGLRPNVSCLSAAIRRRLVTEAEVAQAARVAHGNDAYKFVSEVIWRSYFRGWLELRPVIWRRYLAELKADTARLARELGLAKAYARAIRGETGIDAFDAWNNELVETGYVHNHSRMNYASIWTFTLGLPWTLGAAHFHAHLLCACPAANTLNWRWVVGLQTRGKAYRASAQAIRAMSDGRHQLSAPLATRVVPLSEPAPPAAVLPADPPPPQPLRTGLFVSTEDLSAEQLDYGPADIAAVAATADTAGGGSDLKRTYVATALADGVARAAERFGVEPSRLAGVPDLPTAAVRWAEANRLKQVVTPWLHVGEAADAFAAVEAALTQSGVKVARVIRPMDRLAWPHATRGYAHFAHAFDFAGTPG